MRTFAFAILALLLGAALAPAAPAGAATLTPIGEFDAPTYVTSEPDAEMLLVTQRRGQIELVDHGQVSQLADLSSLVECPSGGCEGERGLMSVAVSPDFATTGHLYVDFSNNSTGQIHIDELTVEGDEAPLSSLRPLLTIEHSDANNHNGGQLQFGPDGDLYISTGDGGGGDDQFHHSQDLDSPLGKLLRIDPNGTIPSNPASAVWSLGLRNPFRFSFDSLTGDMVIGDVGQNEREEVDFAPRLPGGGVGGQGVNYGWNCREGFIEGPATDLPGEECASDFTAGDFTQPVFDYSHEGGRCAIIGGYVVRDQSLGDLYGRYLYGDLCVGELRSLELPASASEEATGDRSEGLTVSNLNSFGEDSCHRVYAVSGNGEVARLEGPTPATCPPPPPPTEEKKETGGGPRLSVGEWNGAGPHRHRRRTDLSLHGPRHQVAPGAPVSLRAAVKPCRAADRGRNVYFYRGGGKIGSDKLDGSCNATLSIKLERSSSVRARVSGNAKFKSDLSNRIRVRISAG
jgi:glucose/arabinose dehydrogenase